MRHILIKGYFSSSCSNVIRWMKVLLGFSDSWLIFGSLVEFGLKYDYVENLKIYIAFRMTDR